MSYYAIDFGTSNSLLSHVSSSGTISPVLLENGSYVLRSLLYSPQNNSWFFGNEAIQEYVNHDGEGRFFRSIKKFLPEPSYNGTVIFNRNTNISELVAIFLKELRLRGNKFTGEDVKRLVLGRPALYSLNNEHDQLAEDRMLKAAQLAGFEEVTFCPEPIAAGLDYNSSSTQEKIVLIADFGGGTSDFTLMKIHQGEYSQSDILGLSGVFIAGDALDGMMMREFISPHFGSQFEYKIPGGTNVLKFPKNLLSKICSPAHITHLREKDTWEFLQHIEKFALSETDSIKMQQLFTLVECQLGFPLFNEIEKTKIKLGKSTESEFLYNFPGIKISQKISKDEFDHSVATPIEEIMLSMQEVFKQSGVETGQVDEVILTGGTSQFPLIQKNLELFFGKEKLYEHNIYQSVVNGLARYAKKLL